MKALVGQGDQPHLLGDQGQCIASTRMPSRNAGKQDHVRHAGRLRR